MMHPTWERWKPWVMQVALIATMAIVGWFAIRPILASIVTKLDDIQKLDALREHRAKQLQQLPELEAQHALIESEEEKLQLVLSKERLVEFIERLERLAQENGVVIAITSLDNAFLESKVTLSEKKPSKPVVTAVTDDEDTPAARRDKKTPGILSELPLRRYLHLTVTVTGSYADIVRFLYRYETLPYALDVIGINMKAHPEEGDRPAPGSGTLDPFDDSLVVPNVPTTKTNLLDADFETVVYLIE
jgi:hypothetical protein